MEFLNAETRFFDDRQPYLVYAIFYPNPASDRFFLVTDTPQKLNIDLFDLNGNHVFNKIISDKTSIDVSALKEGVYTLTIKGLDRGVNKKLIIVR